MWFQSMIHFVEGLHYWFVELTTEFDQSPDTLDVSEYAEALWVETPFDEIPKIYPIHFQPSHQGDAHRLIVVWPQVGTWLEWELKIITEIQDSELDESSIQHWVPLGLTPFIYSENYFEEKSDQISGFICPSRLSSEGDNFIFHASDSGFNNGKTKSWYQEPDQKLKNLKMAQLIEIDLNLITDQMVVSFDLRSSSYQSEHQQKHISKIITKWLSVLIFFMFMICGYSIYNISLPTDKLSTNQISTMQFQVDEFVQIVNQWNQVKRYRPHPWYQNLIKVRSQLDDTEIQRIVIESQSQSQSARWFLKFNDWRSYEKLTNKLGLNWGAPKKIKSGILVQVEVVFQ